MGYVEQCGDSIVGKLLRKLTAETGVLETLVLDLTWIGLTFCTDWFGPSNTG